MNRSFSVLFDDHNLSSVNEVINVLEDGVHTMFQWDINTIPEFDTNDKRWELFQSPKAWKFITEDYRGFWDWIHESKNFKQMIWMNDAHSGQIIEHITAITDNKREFIQNKIITLDKITHSENTHDQRSGRNQINGKSDLIFMYLYSHVSGTSTIYDLSFWVFKYNPITCKMEPFIYPGSDSRGNLILPARQLIFTAGPWVLANTNLAFFVDNNDKVFEFPEIGDSDVGGSVSEREKFVLTIQGAAKAGRLLYGIDNKEHFYFSATALDERAKPVFTNTAETHIVTATSTTRLEFVDRINKEHRSITPNLPIALPDIDTKCTLSPDGTMFAWTDRTASSPRLRIVRLRDGQVIFTSSVNAACANTIWTNSNTIYVNSITGVMSRYVVSGTAEQLFVQEISNYIVPTTAGDYMAHYLEDIRKIVYVKRVAVSNQPLYYIMDEITGRVEHSGTLNSYVGTRVCYGGQSLIRRIPGRRNWILIPTTTANVLILLKYDEQTQLWSETVLTGAPASGPNDQYKHIIPVFFDKGSICAWVQHNRGTSNPVVPVYDLNNGNIIHTLPAQTWSTILKLDESHLAYTGGTNTLIFEVDKVNRRLIQKLEQTGIGRAHFSGFNDT